MSRELQPAWAEVDRVRDELEKAGKHELYLMAEVDRLKAELNQSLTERAILHGRVGDLSNEVERLGEALTEQDYEREQALNILRGCAGSTARRVEQALGVEPQR